MDFSFSFDPSYVGPGRLFGITPASSGVRVTPEEVRVIFGPWRLRTALSNIASVAVTGPYRFWRTAGPAHLSFSDRGLTFASNGRQGVCIEFVEPVPGIEPRGWLRHPNLTVTVDDCAALAAELSLSSSRDGSEF